MLDQFEQNVLRGYLKNFFFKTTPPKKAMSVACDWLEENFELITAQEPSEDFFDQLSQYQSAVKNHSGVRYCQMRILSELKSILESDICDPKLPPGQVEKNLTLLGKELKLDPTDQTLFGLIARYKVNIQLEDLADKLSREGFPPQMIISLLTGLDRSVIGKRLSAGQHLVSSGLIQLKTYKGNDITDRFDLPDAIADALLKSSDNLDCFRTHILGTPVSPELEWEDFLHLDGIPERLALFLKKSIHKNLAGVNILLWGSPGTGKTEFCKTLAHKIKCDLYAVGETDDDGDEPSRKERLDALGLAQSLLRYQQKNFLMFDEMDDLFERSPVSQFFGGKFKAPSKIFTNRLFESNHVPTIWIINDVNSLDEAIVRRMSLVVEIKSPPRKSRKQVWERIINKHGINLPPQDFNEIVNLEISPAVLDNAVRFAQVTGKGHEDVMFASRGMIKAIKGKSRQVRKQPSCYRPELLNTDMDLDALGHSLRASEHKQFSLCLYGQPGTGKTEYVRQLANQLGMEVLVKKSSDLLGSYVGETEKAIAAAFQEAVDNESFLVFDEADSLLGDRRHALRGWEVSQVNEMLTWMESHPYPFACTTNLMDRLDQASLRRFTFKVGFNPLTDAQNRLAFQEFFGINAPKTIGKLSNLTPGDFMVVRNKARIMGVLGKSEKLVEMLNSESSVKQRNGKQIGFDV